MINKELYSWIFVGVFSIVLFVLPGLGLAAIDSVFFPGTDNPFLHLIDKVFYWGISLALIFSAMALCISKWGTHLFAPNWDEACEIISRAVKNPGKNTMPDSLIAVGILFSVSFRLYVMFNALSMWAVQL